MGSINTEVVQVTTTANTSFPTPGTSSGSTRIDWFEGPPGDAGYEENGRGRADSENTWHTVTRITADPPPPPPSPRHRLGSFAGRVRRGLCPDHWRGRFSRMDPVKLKYLRTSFVFAVSVLVTWTPSSINRVHDILRAGNPPSFGLNLASAVVLPLQGIWNAVIFFSTSGSAVREELHAVVDRLRGLPRGHQTAQAVRCERERAVELERRITNTADQADDSGTDGADSKEISAPGTDTAREESISDISEAEAGASRGAGFGPSVPDRVLTASSSTMRVIRGGHL